MIVIPFQNGYTLKVSVIFVNSLVNSVTAVQVVDLGNRQAEVNVLGADDA